MSVGTVHLLYGLGGSGKTTWARQQHDAVRFTLDEWMTRLQPDLSIDASDYGRRAEAVKSIIWSVAEQVLSTGTDVVLDWNSWSRQRRAWAVQRARSVGADVVLHWLSTSVAESSARAEQRIAAGAVYAHRLNREDNEHLATLMEPPSEDEGLPLIRHWSNVRDQC